MGFFYDYRVLQEIDIKEPDPDETKKQDDNELDSDSKEDQNSEPKEQSEEESDQIETDTNDDETPSEENQDDNFDDLDGDDTTGEEDPADDDSQSSEVDNNDDEVDDIKKQEEELYANLSKEQLDIKHKELKSQFLAIFDTTTDITKRLTNINVKQEYLGTVEYVANVISGLRDILTDYMNSVYKTKSYTENSVNYNRFLAALNGINRILEEIGKNED